MDFTFASTAKAFWHLEAGRALREDQLHRAGYEEAGKIRTRHFTVADLIAGSPFFQNLGNQRVGTT